MITALLEEGTREQLWAGPVIDCDVHAVVPSLEALFPYQPKVWVEAARERGYRGPTGLPLIYPPALPTTARPEWREAGKVPASSVEQLRRHILDPWRVERAVLNCYYAIDSLRHPDWAIALARSVNDWLAAEWLEQEPRLAGSIAIPARDPAAAAAEIDRVAKQYRGFVQVLLPVRSERLYGQRVFWPLFEAIERNGLVAGLHWGGLAEHGPTPSGYASWYVEEYAEEVQLFGSQLTSMIVEGLFQKFRGLRVSVLEAGFAWLPTWAWNLNKKWKGLRREFPWVDRLPSDIIREHFRFSTAPADLGPAEQTKTILHWLRSDDLLMYASDYPHLHTDDLGELLGFMGEKMRGNVMSETARRWYRF